MSREHPSHFQLRNSKKQFVLIRTKLEQSSNKTILYHKTFYDAILWEPKVLERYGDYWAGTSSKHALVDFFVKFIIYRIHISRNGSDRLRSGCEWLTICIHCFPIVFNVIEHLFALRKSLLALCLRSLKPHLSSLQLEFKPTKNPNAQCHQWVCPIN